MGCPAEPLRYWFEGLCHVKLAGRAAFSILG